MNLFKIKLFLLMLLSEICIGAIQPEVTIKKAGSLRIIQSYEIQNFIKDFTKCAGFDINLLWDGCIDCLSEKEKLEIYSSKVLCDKFVKHVSILKARMSKSFDEYIQSKNKDIFETNNQNINTFLDGYKIRGCKVKPLQYLSLELSQLASDCIKKHVVKIQNPNNLDLLNAIKEIVLSYFDLKSLETRLSQGDEVIFDIPATPVMIQYYDDESVEVYGLPEMRQDIILTENDASIEENQSFFRRKFLAFLFVAAEFAAMYTTPLYQATLSAIHADCRQKQAVQEKIDQALKILELSPGATQQEIRAKYRQMSLRVHPDKPNGSTEKFEEIAQAYELLKK